MPGTVSSNPKTSKIPVTFIDNLGITLKYVLGPLLIEVIDRAAIYVEKGIQSSKSFNLQFLVIVLLLITLTLGIAWIIILIKDNSDVIY